MKKQKEGTSNFITKLDINDAYCRERANYDIMTALNRIESSEGQLDQLVHYAAVRNEQKKLILNKENCNEKLDYLKKFNK